MLKLVLSALILCSTASAVREGACPEGWLGSRSTVNCFKVVTGNKKTWCDAKQACENLGADLFLAIDFTEELDVMKVYKDRTDKGTLHHNLNKSAVL